MFSVALEEAFSWLKYNNKITQMMPSGPWRGIEREKQGH